MIWMTSGNTSLPTASGRSTLEEILASILKLVPFPHQGQSRPDLTDDRCASSWFANI